MSSPPRRLGRTALASILFALLAATALAGVSVLAPSGGAALTPAEAQALDARQALPDIVEGRADAPATIVEYASLTCSHCAAFHRDVWPLLKAKYVDSGEAKFVLREFPLDNLSLAAFMVARCAGPDRRDAIADRLFDHQADWAFAGAPLDRLKAQALAAGMTAAAVDACLKNQALLDAVTQVRETAATKLGVDSTPTFFVAGKRLSADHSLAKFDEILGPTAK